MTVEETGRLTAKLLSGSWRPAAEAPSSRSAPQSPLAPGELATLVPIFYLNGSCGLSWWRIKDTALRDHPDASLLRDGFRLQTLRAREMEGHLTSMVTFLRERGVDPVVGKGWAVGRLYPGPGLRPYGDLDLLVSPSELSAARAALVEPGRPEAPVELHENFRQLHDRKPEDLVGRAHAVVLNGMEIRVLAPEDHLRLLTLHGLCHGLWRPLWLCDVVVFLEWIAERPESFDWELCMSGDEWRSPGVRCGLGLARELLGADLEAAGVPEAWRESPLPSWMAPAALRAWGARRHYLHHGDPRDLLGKPLKLLRAARLRWSNPLEVTYRREAPWDDSPRIPHQVVDYLSRTAGVLRDVAARLRRGR